MVVREGDRPVTIDSGRDMPLVLKSERPVVPLEPAAKMDWFDLANENEFALLDLNYEVHIEQVTAIEDSLERMPAN
ncbi:hypothetical protein WN943_011291 [Citrus x changshan-huyou]